MSTPIATTALTLKDESALCQIAKQFSAVIKPGDIIFLEGQLGAGKTTFVRHFLQALGYTGKVKSPTYTVVESYVIGQQTVHHFDWYRLSEDAALEDLGFRDYIDGKALCFIEWPTQVPGFTLDPNWHISLALIPDQPTARLFTCKPALT
ncbi:MAG: hypothetical protein RLZ35_361 [Pseudomonadota bacterium]|jgi:tRNA threonylcarbamoyladenosine biosynthesis protein TsaE